MYLAAKAASYKLWRGAPQSGAGRVSATGIVSDAHMQGS